MSLYITYHFSHCDVWEEANEWRLAHMCCTSLKGCFHHLWRTSVWPSSSAPLSSCLELNNHTSESSRLVVLSCYTWTFTVSIISLFTLSTSVNCSIEGSCFNMLSLPYSAWMFTDLMKRIGAALLFGWFCFDSLELSSLSHSSPLAGWLGVCLGECLSWRQSLPWCPSWCPSKPSIILNTKIHISKRLLV